MPIRSSSYEAFGLLLSQIWESEETSLVMRRAGDDDNGLVYAADRQGHRHLLAPIPSSLAFEEVKGSSLELTELTVRGRRYLDLVCTADSLAHVFASMADQVVRQVEEGQGPAFQVMQKTLGEWRQLLKPSPALSEDEARGLFGELHVLAQLVQRNPGYALDAWTGPDKALHDFTTSHGDLEVKSSGTEGLGVVISALHQVDPPEDRPLTLVRLHVTTSPTGKNIRDMVDELCSAGLLHDQLVAKLAGARFIFGDDPDKHRFVVASTPAAWNVDDDFPGLRASDVPSKRLAAIRGVKYSLDLVAAGDPMTGDEFERVLDGLVGA